jgi:hypothetical protein
MSTGTTGYTEGLYTPEQASGWTDRCCAELSKAVDENPAGTLLAAFGAGLGIGVALALTVALPAVRPKKKSLSEEIGSRVLASLQDILPDSLAKKLG